MKRNLKNRNDSRGKRRKCESVPARRRKRTATEFLLTHLVGDKALLAKAQTSSFAWREATEGRHQAFLNERCSCYLHLDVQTAEKELHEVRDNVYDLVVRHDGLNAMRLLRSTYWWRVFGCAPLSLEASNLRTKWKGKFQRVDPEQVNRVLERLDRRYEGIWELKPDRFFKELARLYPYSMMPAVNENLALSLA